MRSKDKTIEVLIDLIKNQPVTWDAKLSDHKNINVTNKAYDDELKGLRRAVGQPACIIPAMTTVKDWRKKFRILKECVCEEVERSTKEERASQVLASRMSEGKKRGSGPLPWNFSTAARPRKGFGVSSLCRDQSQSQSQDADALTTVDDFISLANNDGELPDLDCTLGKLGS